MFRNDFPQQLDKPYFMGVDIGGTTISAIVVDLDMMILEQATFSTDLTSPSRTIDSIILAIKQTAQNAKVPLASVAHIGIGIPGKVDVLNGHVNLAVNLNWQDVAAGQMLSQALDLPCSLENDLNTAALGCYHFLNPEQTQNLAYVSIGTGLAAGLILNGRLYRGAHGMAGEFGHIVVDPQGPRCKCGNYGCLEVFTAGPAIAQAGRQAVSAGQLTLPNGSRPITAQDVFKAAKAANPAAQHIINTAAGYLGRGLQALIMAYDVDKIILGGGISQAGEFFRQTILREWTRQANLSPLAADMLHPDKLNLAPTEHNAGTWGGVALSLIHSHDPHLSSAASHLMLKEVIG